MGKIRDGDKVRYIGPPQEVEGGYRSGDIGVVLNAEDYNGDAIITFEPSGVWTRKDQESLEFAERSDTTSEDQGEK